MLRTVGDDHEPRAFQTFCPTVIALIGSLPDTLHDRALAIELKRKLRSEKADPFRPDRADHLDVLARKAMRWAKDHAEAIGAADPEMPAGIINRAADNWRPLLAIADLADGAWSGPDGRARKAAEAAHTAAADDDASRLELLLGDIRDIFAERQESQVEEMDRIPSGDLVKALVAIEARPCSRKPLTQNGLARRLKPLGIAPDLIGPKTDRVRGYARSQFKEAFERYLGPEGVSQPFTRSPAHEMGASDNSQPFTHPPEVNGCKMQETQQPRAGERVNTLRERSEGAYGNDPPGLSSYRIRELAEDYTERAYANAQENEGDTRTADLDAWLRQRLADEGVLPEYVETEFARIMREVFRA